MNPLPELHQNQVDIISMPQYPIGYIRDTRTGKPSNKISLSGVNIVNGKEFNWKWEVTGHPDHGLPCGIETEIEVAIYYFFQQYGQVIQLSKSDILKALNYPNTQFYLEAIKRGIIKLYYTNINAVNCLINPTIGTPYQEFDQFVFMQRLRGIHYGSDSENLKGQTSVESIMNKKHVYIGIELSNAISTLLQNSKGFGFDWEAYVSIPDFKTRRLFRILNSMRRLGIDLVDLKDLGQRMPLFASKPSRLVRLLSPSLEELKRAGHIHKYGIYNNDKVALQFTDTPVKPKELQKKMRKQGVAPGIAKRLTTDLTTSAEFKQMAFNFFIEVKREDNTVNAGTLVKLIKEKSPEVINWAAAKNTPKKINQEPAVKSEDQEPIDDMSEENEARETILGLPDSEFFELVGKAEENASQFAREFIQKIGKDRKKLQGSMLVMTALIDCLTCET